MTLTFDSLHSQVSNVIKVYPGVRANSVDRTSNGTYDSGDQIAAVCKAFGRPISSAPSAGETNRKSNTWIRIAATDHATEYATLTYADLPAGALARLPECSGVT